jgi:hypothetical protein
MAHESMHIAFCPHCGNTAPQKVVLRHSHGVQLYKEDGSVEQEFCPEGEAIICVCQTCNEVLLYDGLAEDETGDWPRLQYPRSPDLPASVPTHVSDIYVEASRVKRIAPNAFAVLLRRALETICEDRGVATGSLAKRLQALSDRGEIPPLLAEVSDVVRILGNVGAHASDISIRPQDTWAAIVSPTNRAPSVLSRMRFCTWTMVFSLLPWNQKTENQTPSIRRLCRGTTLPTTRAKMRVTKSLNPTLTTAENSAGTTHASTR